MNEITRAILAGESGQDKKPRYSDITARVLASQQYQPELYRADSPNWAARMGRGFMDVGQGIKQLYMLAADPEAAKEYTKAVNKEIASYEAGRGPDAGFDWMRLSGNIAGSAPVSLLPGGAAASTAGRFGGAALQGAAAGLGMYDESGTLGGRAVNAAAGGIGGLAGQAVSSGIAGLAARAKAGADRLIGSMMPDVRVNNVFQSHGIDVADDATQAALRNVARQQLRATGKVDPETLRRIANAEALGFSGESAPTMAQATRSPKAWTRERNLAKLDEVGDDLIGRYRNQDARFSSIMDDMKPPVPTSGKYEAGSALFDATMREWKGSQARVGALYGAARQQFGDQPVDLAKFAEIASEAMDDEVTRAIPKSALNALRRHGVIDAEGNATGKMLTVEKAEGIRKFINGLGAQDPSSKRMRAMMVDALDDTVIDSFGDDAFREARSAARARFKQFEGNMLNRIVNGKNAPDEVYKLAMGSRVGELKAMRDLFLQNEAGKSAWDGLRKQVLQDIQDEATKTGKWSGKGFERAVDRVGKERMGVLFSPDEVKRLSLVRSVGADLTTDPAYSAVNYSNTAPTMANLMKMAGNVPLISDKLRQVGEQWTQEAAVNRALNQTAFDPGLYRGMINANAARYRGLLDYLDPALLGSFAAQSVYPPK